MPINRDRNRSLKETAGAHWMAWCSFAPSRRTINGTPYLGPFPSAARRSMSS